MERVIGLGGPFIQAKNPKELADWYERYLGISFGGNTYTDWPFQLKSGETKPGFNVLSFFKQSSDYFAPSQKEVMINFIVKDLLSLLAVLQEEGVQIVGDMTEDEFGKFGWIMDPEGNKLELWEPPA